MAANSGAPDRKRRRRCGLVPISSDYEECVFAAMMSTCIAPNSELEEDQAPHLLISPDPSHRRSQGDDVTATSDVSGCEDLKPTMIVRSLGKRAFTEFSMNDSKLSRNGKCGANDHYESADKLDGNDAMNFFRISSAESDTSDASQDSDADAKGQPVPCRVEIVNVFKEQCPQSSGVPAVVKDWVLA